MCYIPVRLEVVSPWILLGLSITGVGVVRLSSVTSHSMRIISVSGVGRISISSNGELDPDGLVAFSRTYFAGRPCKEDSILLVIDEAQLLFNARDWSVRGRDRWNWFFTMHRHFGFFIILCAQFDRMLDRQVRGLIEYEYIHRKVNNMGWKGVFLSCLLLSPTNLFVKVKIWYPMKEKVGSEFFQCRKRYYSIYDTFALLDRADRRTEGGVGATPGDCPVCPDVTTADDAPGLSPVCPDTSNCCVDGTSTASI